MKRYLVLILLFVAFNANAIEGSMMMSTMVIGMDKNMSMEQAHDMDSHHDNDDSEMPDHGKMSESKDKECDDNISCGVCLFHCTSAILEIDIPAFSFLGLVSFKPNYTPSEVSSNYTRLLRPPNWLPKILKALLSYASALDSLSMTQ